MNKMNYNEPFFKVTKTNAEDVLTTSETIFGALNGFESTTSTPSLEEGGWNMPGITL